MSQLPAFLNNLFDEETSNFDSFTKNSLNTLSSGFISQGTISSAFDRDYYQITLTAGDYTVSMTSDASLYGWNTFQNDSFLEFDIIDEFGTIVRTSSPTLLFDDSNAFTFSGAFGTFYVDVHTTGFSSADYALTLISQGSSGGSSPSPTPTNTAPVALNDTATATAGQSVTINIGSNDRDADGDTLATSGFTNPSKGTVTYLENSSGFLFSAHDHVRYTPFSTATGTDSFRYQISDGKGGTDTATVTVTISSANRDPVALNDTATATAGVATTIRIGSNDSDADGDRLTTTGLTGFFDTPRKGTVSYRDNTFSSDTVTYTPFSTATGTDSFRYQVSDGKGGTDTATVTVTITGANRDPVALNDTATARAGVATVISIGSNDSDPDNDRLTTSGVSGQGPSKGTVSYRDNFSTADTVTYTPFSTATGTDRFTYQVSDGKGGTDTATVTVTFANQVPVALNDTATVTAGQSVTINIGSNDSDADGDRLTTTGFTNPSKGTVSYTENTFSADTVRYTPFSTATGTDSFRYQVSDGKGGTDTATVTVTISAADLAGNTSTTGRVTVGESVTSEHTSFDFQDWFAVSLVSGKQYVFDVKGSSSGQGTMSNPYLELFSGTGVFLRGNNNSGIGNDAQITYTATTTGTHYLASTSANVNGFSTGTYTLSASTNNRTPVAVNDTIIFPADSFTGFTYTAPLSLNDSDADGDDLFYSLLTEPSKTTATIVDSAGFNVDEFLIIKAYPGATGIEALTYLVDDGNGGTATATLTINLDSSFNGDDIINGFAHNDIFVAGLGSDSFFGHAGSDTIKFDGTRSEYTYQEVGNSVVISDSQISRDGIDTLNSIETYAFTDRDYTLAELINPTDIDRGIYRFFNVDTGTHFLSGSTVERDSVINNLDSFNFEGPTFRAADPTNPAADTVFRFFNTQTGTHFFTQSTAERDNILETLPQFSFEGEAYKGYTEEVADSTPLYRFFNTQTGTHFYTAAEAEKDSIIENLPSFNFEGTAYWVDPVMG